MAKKEVYTWHDTLNSISYHLKRIADSLESIEVQNDMHREPIRKIEEDPCRATSDSSALRIFLSKQSQN